MFLNNKFSSRNKAKPKSDEELGSNQKTLRLPGSEASKPFKLGSIGNFVLSHRKQLIAIYAYSFALSLAYVLIPYGLDRGAFFCLLATFFFSIPLAILISTALAMINQFTPPHRRLQ